MKYKIHNIFFVVAVIYMIMFVLLTIVDYVRYDTMLTAAPFYVFVLEKVVDFMLPAIICTLIGLIFKHKHRE